jgi:hypothetical protein
MRCSVRADLIAQELGDELLIINGSNDTVCILNRTGAALFHALKEPVSKQELIDKLAGVYQVSPQTIAVDVEEYLGELDRQGILQWMS